MNDDLDNSSLYSRSDLIDLIHKLEREIEMILNSPLIYVPPIGGQVGYGWRRNEAGKLERYWEKIS